MRRFLLPLVLTAAALIVPAAQAGAPVSVSLPSFDFTDSTCGFDIAVHGTSGATMRIFDDGTIRITGPLTGTFTANGKSITLNVSGPATISGTTMVGRGVGVGDIQLPDGRVTFAEVAGVSDTSVTPNVLLRGHVLLDLCAALAP